MSPRRTRARRSFVRKRAPWLAVGAVVLGGTGVATFAMAGASDGPGADIAAARPVAHSIALSGKDPKKRSLPRTDTKAFSLLGVTWQDSAEDFEGTAQIRTRSAETGTWTQWQDLDFDVRAPETAEGQDTGVRGTSEPLWVGASDGVEARVLADGQETAVPDGLRLDMVDPGETVKGKGKPSQKPKKTPPGKPAPGASEPTGGSQEPDPSSGPTDDPTDDATSDPGDIPTDEPTSGGTDGGTADGGTTGGSTQPPTEDPVDPDPTDEPAEPTSDPTGGPTGEPDPTGTPAPTEDPSDQPVPSEDPTSDPAPTDAPSGPADPDPTAPDPTDPAEGPAEDPTTAPTTDPSDPAEPSAPSGPQITARADWGADESLVQDPPTYLNKVDAVFVHHTAGTNDYTCAESPAIIRAIFTFHVKQNGWNDVGYNFFVDKCGTVFEGRAGGVERPVQGAHTYGFNGYSSGVSVLGNYESGGTPTPAAKKALADIAAWKLGLHGVDPQAKVTLTAAGDTGVWKKGDAATLYTISGHRDGFATLCPGASLYSALPEIRTTAGSSTYAAP
jgi:hypothetical protein